MFGKDFGFRCQVKIRCFLCSFRITSAGHTHPSVLYNLSDNCCEPLTNYSSKREDFPAKVLDISNVTHFGDPRLAELGWRIFGPAEINTEQLFPGISSSQNISVKDSEEGYKALKYTLGVGEGVVDIPFGNSFPLEVSY